MDVRSELFAGVHLNQEPERPRGVKQNGVRQTTDPSKVVVSAQIGICSQACLSQHLPSENLQPQVLALERVGTPAG